MREKIFRSALDHNFYDFERSNRRHGRSNA